MSNSDSEEDFLKFNEKSLQIQKESIIPIGQIIPKISQRLLSVAPKNSEIITADPGGITDIIKQFIASTIRQYIFTPSGPLFLCDRRSFYNHQAHK